MWPTQYNIIPHYCEIIGTFLPPPFTLPENVKCHLTSKASPGLAVLTLFHFFSWVLFPSETLVYYLSLTIRLYTPDLVPITQKDLAQDRLSTNINEIPNMYINLLCAFLRSFCED